MPKKAKKSSKQLVDRVFFEYLLYFYQDNRRKSRQSCSLLSKKFLDFNDPENADSFLRAPQFHALYDIEEYERDEPVDVTLANPPKAGKPFHEFSVKPE
ncbi:MAG: hypothetical protein U5R06_15770 [candidate division KSB1 bacterium]|nr:hypothetical protein [candidate division KSB1 bacterium]